jgi:hypothetical protein
MISHDAISILKEFAAEVFLPFFLLPATDPSTAFALLVGNAFFLSPNPNPNPNPNP